MLCPLHRQKINPNIFDGTNLANCDYSSFLKVLIVILPYLTAKTNLN